MDYKCSPNYILTAPNPKNVIRAFKERIEKYHFEPIEMLNDKKFGFAATALLASLIDILAKTENHSTSTKTKSQYINWLITNFKFKPKLAIFFYENFRCGLLHAGCVELGGQISYLQKTLFRTDHGILFRIITFICKIHRENKIKN